MRYGCYASALASLASLFLYAGFDVQWWSPLESAGRAFLLGVIHFVALVAGVFAAVEQETEPVSAIKRTYGG